MPITQANSTALELDESAFFLIRLNTRQRQAMTAKSESLAQCISLCIWSMRHDQKPARKAAAQRLGLTYVWQGSRLLALNVDAL